ncbi:SDR family oxidoreductase [Bdellovibrio sp. HCB2-146]|uniref:SDR family oxidoreductase n=1 Tax=Bdellovibrio sp. HCB2-146 TaxID=3394362 RepID=UPI0039BD8095
MGQRFAGKTILVTGGNSGIGFATAKRIVSEGGKVIITGRDPQTLKQAQMELGPNAEAIQADVSRLSEIDSMYAQIKNKYGHIDGLFANAGIAKFNPVEAVSEAEYDQLFDVNVKGVFFTMQKAIPLLSKGSSVVVNASVAGSTGSATSTVYSATKAAVRSMARTFSGACLEKGIRFNVVSPGPIETPIWNRPGTIPGEAVAQTKQAVAEKVPLKRYGTVDEVTGPIVFLLSNESTYILGAELFVDGGSTQL